jgi:hypothetical protein
MGAMRAFRGTRLTLIAALIEITRRRDRIHSLPIY